MSIAKVDVHTHLGQHGTHVCGPLADDEIKAWGKVSWDVTPGEHARAAASADTSIVLAFDAEPVGVVVPNDYVAQQVAGKPELIGFASVNPTRANATTLLVQAIEELGLRGLKLGPTYQHFHLHDKALSGPAGRGRALPDPGDLASGHNLHPGCDRRVRPPAST